MHALVVAAVVLGASAGIAFAQGGAQGGGGASSGGTTGSGGAALGGAPPAAGAGGNTPVTSPGGAPAAAPVPQPALNRLNGVGSLPTTRRAGSGYDDGFAACMAMWEGGETGMTKQEWTRTCNAGRIPPPPGTRR